MKTDELIVQLARAAKPVTPLRPPSIRLAQWMAWTLAIGGLGVLLIGPRADLSSAIGAPAYALSLALLLVTTVGAAAAAFVLAVPGAERSWLQRGLPVAAALAWPVIWVVVMVRAAGSGAASTPFHWACAIEIFVLAALSGRVLLGMIRRAAPLRPAWTAATVSLAAVGSAAAATQVICPISGPAHQLIGHVLVAAIIGLAGLLAGRRVLSS